MGQFFEELKRRNVLRIAAAYVVVSWLIIQVVETIFPVFGFGDAGIRFVIIVLAIGFIPALILSWAFEITPEGLKKEKDVDRSQSVTAHTGKKLDRWIMVVLVFALGYFAIDKFALSPQREVAQQQQQAEQLASATEEARQEGRSQALTESYGDKSIAVLPFADMSPMHDQEYMSDGIAEELLNLLVKIPELRVISRTSAFAFKGKDIDIPTIAEQLNVAHILEGSVRKAGDRIRITAQLIEARSDTHLWSETYDRVLDDIFAIQDEISAEIASVLEVQLLGGSEDSSSAASVTTSTETYDLYLRGLRNLNINSFASLAAAIDYFEQAVELDAAFLPAQAGLARTIWSQGWIGVVDHDLAADQAEEIAQEILGIDPDFAAGHVILGLVARERNNFSLAIEHYERALALGDSDPETMAELVRMLLYTGGDPIRMRALLDRAMQSDPLNAELHLVAWETKLIQGTSDGALEILLRAAELAPDSVIPVVYAGIYSGKVLGNVADTIRYMEEAERTDPDDPDYGVYLGRAYIALGDGAKAQYWSSRAVDLSPKYGRAILSKVEQLRQAGRSDEAFALAQETLAATDITYRGLKYDRIALENSVVRSFFGREDYVGAEEFLLTRYPGLPQLLDGTPAQDLDGLSPAGHNFLAVLELAYIYRQLGRGEDADRLIENLDFVTTDNINFVYEDEVTPFEGPRIQLRGDDHWGLAVVAAGRQQADPALTHLETAAELGYLMYWPFRFIDHPALWSLRDQPRYKALIASIEANMAEQRQTL